MSSQGQGARGVKLPYLGIGQDPKYGRRGSITNSPGHATGSGPTPNPLDFGDASGAHPPSVFVGMGAAPSSAAIRTYSAEPVAFGGRSFLGVSPPLFSRGHYGDPSSRSLSPATGNSPASDEREMDANDDGISGDGTEKAEKGRSSEGKKSRPRKKLKWTLEKDLLLVKALITYLNIAVEMGMEERVERPLGWIADMMRRFFPEYRIEVIRNRVKMKVFNYILTRLFTKIQGSQRFKVDVEELKAANRHLHGALAEKSCSFWKLSADDVNFVDVDLFFREVAVEILQSFQRADRAEKGEKKQKLQLDDDTFNHIANRCRVDEAAVEQAKRQLTKNESKNVNLEIRVISDGRNVSPALSEDLEEEPKHSGSKEKASRPRSAGRDDDTPFGPRQKQRVGSASRSPRAIAMGGRPIVEHYTSPFDRRTHSSELPMGLSVEVENDLDGRFLSVASVGHQRAADRRRRKVFSASVDEGFKGIMKGERELEFGVVALTEAEREREKERERERERELRGLRQAQEGWAANSPSGLHPRVPLPRIHHHRLSPEAAESDEDIPVAASIVAKGKVGKEGSGAATLMFSKKKDRRGSGIRDKEGRDSLSPMNGRQQANRPHSAEPFAFEFRNEVLADKLEMRESPVPALRLEECLEHSERELSHEKVEHKDGGRQKWREVKTAFPKECHSQISSTSDYSGSLDQSERGKPAGVASVPPLGLDRGNSLRGLDFSKLKLDREKLVRKELLTTSSEERIMAEKEADASSCEGFDGNRNASSAAMRMACGVEQEFMVQPRGPERESIGESSRSAGKGSARASQSQYSSQSSQHLPMSSPFSASGQSCSSPGFLPTSSPSLHSLFGHNSPLQSPTGSSPFAGGNAALAGSSSSAMMYGPAFSQPAGPTPASVTGAPAGPPLSSATCPPSSVQRGSSGSSSSSSQTGKSWRSFGGRMSVDRDSQNSVGSFLRDGERERSQTDLMEGYAESRGSVVSNLSSGRSGSGWPAFDRDSLRFSAIMSQYQQQQQPPPQQQPQPQEQLQQRGEAPSHIHDQSASVYYSSVASHQQQQQHPSNSFNYSAVGTPKGKTPLEREFPVSSVPEHEAFTHGQSDALWGTEP